MGRHEFNHRRLAMAATAFVAAVVCALCLAPATAEADDDDFFRAKTIALNQVYAASAAEARDDMVYRFDLAQAGPVRIRISGSAQAWGEWDVSLHGASRDDDEIVEYEVETRRGSHETTDIGLAAGTYYLEVEGDDDDWSRRATYSLEVSFTASDSWESESNDSPRRADPITLNAVTSATTFSVGDDDDDDREDWEDWDDWDDWDDDDDEDEDWFKFSLSSPRRVSIHLSGAQGRGAWNIQLFARDAVRPSRALLSATYRSSSLSYGSESIELGAGTYYVRVDPTSGVSGLAYGLYVQDEDNASGMPSGGEMHRLYNPWSGEHFYTSDGAEFESLRRSGWSDEGRGWTSPESGTPVWRLYNPYVPGGDHHYTMNWGEYDSLRRAGWIGEGIGWYSTTEGNGEPVYRQYNPYAVTGTHNYTLSLAENNALVDAGWHAEGIAWYSEK